MLETLLAKVNRKYFFLLVVYLLMLALSATAPRNKWLWFAEALPTIVGAILLVSIFPNFKFTYVTYFIILFSFACMLLGSYYAFHSVPILKFEIPFLTGGRNNFDKFGHFFQGIVPALVVKELFVQKKLLNAKWIGLVNFCICSTVASVYEVIEYLACYFAGSPLDAFLGTQGFTWDSQSDMLMAMLGALLIIIPLSRFHNKLISKEYPNWNTNFRTDLSE